MSHIMIIDRLCDLKQNGNSLLSLRAHFFYALDERYIWLRK